MTTTTPAVKKPKPPPGRTKGTRSLTVAQKAEAATIWRMGEMTLEELGKKFRRRPETMSRLFKSMGIEKGSGAKEAVEAAKVAATAAVTSDAERLVQRIAQVKDQHLRMSDNLAKIAYAKVLRAHQAGLKLQELKDEMLTLKIAGELIGNARKEAYVLLGIEEHDKKVDDEDLPDLTVRELTPGEVKDLQQQSSDDGLDTDAADLGADMVDFDDGDATT